MNIIAWGVPLLYSLLIIALCGYLLIRGITHAFVGLFAAGALLHMLQAMTYIFLTQMPGGIGAYSTYLPLVGIVGGIGTVISAAAFITLTTFLVRPVAPSA
jgi:hypothetical protein